MNNCSLCHIPVASPYRFNGKTYCPQCVELELPRLMRESRKEPTEVEPTSDDIQYMDDAQFYEEFGREKYK